jgi:hypothetical protein
LSFLLIFGFPFVTIHDVGQWGALIMLVFLFVIFVAMCKKFPTCFCFVVVKGVGVPRNFMFFFPVYFISIFFGSFWKHRFVVVKGVGVPMNFKFFIHVYFILIFLVLSSSIGDRELQFYFFIFLWQ